MDFKFYTNREKGLKIKVRMFLGIILTFVEITGEKLVEGPFWPLFAIWNRVKVGRE